MLFWSQIPLVKIFIPFALGVLIATIFSISFPIWYGAVIIFVLLSLFLLLYKKTKSNAVWNAFLHLILLTLGILMFSLQKEKSGKKVLPTNKQLSWIGVVEETTYLSDSTQRAVLQLQILIDEDNVSYPNTTLLVYLKSSDLLEVGDKVGATSFINEIPSIKNPVAFNYGKYMERKGIFYQSFVTNVEKVGKQRSFKRTAALIRGRLIENYQKMGLKDDNISVLIAISLGDKTYLESDLRAKYAAAGVMHVLAVSGLHLGIVYLLFSTLLSPLIKLPRGKIIQGCLLLFFIWFFAFLTGFSPSVQRAAIMFSFIVVGNIATYPTHTLNSIFGSALLILLINPLMLLEVGFQLSYAAVIGIVLIHPIVYRLWLSSNRLVNKIWSLVVVSLAAQLATLPLVIFYFHQFPNWFLLANLFVIPLAFLIVSSAVLASLLYVLFSTALGINFFLIAALNLVNTIVNHLNTLPYFITEDLWVSLSSAIALGVALVFLMVFLNYFNFAYLRYSLLFLFFVVGIEFSLNLRQSSKQYFNIYATNGETVYSYVDGLWAVVFIEGFISEYHRQMVHQHLKSIGVRDYEYHSLYHPLTHSSFQYIKSEHYGLLSFGAQKVLFTDLSMIKQMKGMCELDYIVLKKGTILQEDQLKNCTASIILDGSISSWDVAYKKLIDEHLVKAVNESGFYAIY